MEPTIAHPSPVQVIGRVSECVRRLMEVGLTYEALQKPIDDPIMRKRLVNFWLSGGFEATTSQKRSREIMGKNFFGVEEAIKFFGVNPTRQQLIIFSKIPFSEAVLEQLKNTHVLVAVFPLSILEIRDKVERKLFRSHKEAMYNQQFFAREHGEISWQLVCKTPVENSTAKDWSEQQALLGQDDEVPIAQVMVYTIIGLYLATGERIFKDLYVRTSSLSCPRLNHANVGSFSSYNLGLDINIFWGGERFEFLGVSSARKSQ